MAVKHINLIYLHFSKLGKNRCSRRQGSGKILEARTGAKFAPIFITSRNKGKKPKKHAQTKKNFHITSEDIGILNGVDLQISFYTSLQPCFQKILFVIKESEQS